MNFLIILLKRPRIWEDGRSISFSSALTLLACSPIPSKMACCTLITTVIMMVYSFPSFLFHNITSSKYSLKDISKRGSKNVNFRIKNTRTVTHSSNSNKNKLTWDFRHSKTLKKTQKFIQAVPCWVLCVRDRGRSDALETVADPAPGDSPPCSASTSPDASGRTYWTQRQAHQYSLLRRRKVKVKRYSKGIRFRICFKWLSLS